MRKIESRTIDSYVRFLKVVKDQEGKEFDLAKAVAAFHLQNSSAFYARKLTREAKPGEPKFFDFQGNKILKVYYDKAEPILARKLIEGMHQIRRTNRLRKIEEKSQAPTISAPKHVPRQVAEQEQTYEPKFTADDMRKFNELQAMINKQKAQVIEMEPKQSLKPAKTEVKTKSQTGNGYRIKIFGMRLPAWLFSIVP